MAGVGHKKGINVSVGLVHWPVLDKPGDVIATNITNFDIHDIARTSRSYGVSQYFIIHRSREQLMYVGRILDHWRVGYGTRWNPNRNKAMDIVRPEETIESALKTFDEKPIVVATAAREFEGVPRVSFRELHEQMHESPGRPYLLLFGTGFGLTEEVLGNCDLLLEPIWGASEDNFRHLPVRSAVSICLDRLLATW